MGNMHGRVFRYGNTPNAIDLRRGQVSGVGVQTDAMNDVLRIVDLLVNSGEDTSTPPFRMGDV